MWVGNKIIIIIRGTHNGDMSLGLVCVCVGVSAVCCRKGLLSGEEMPDFTGTHRGLQYRTLSGVISHKASLILHKEQLRGLWSEIRRCTIHFLRITSLIIHLNCSERLS